MKKETIYKSIRDFGIGLILGGIGLTTHYGLKANKNKDDPKLFSKYVNIAFYSLMETQLIGVGAFGIGQNKLNNLEKKVEEQK